MWGELDGPQKRCCENTLADFGTSVISIAKDFASFAQEAGILRRREMRSMANSRT
jgi:hypothetical protein